MLMHLQALTVLAIQNTQGIGWFRFGRQFSTLNRYLTTPEIPFNKTNTSQTPWCQSPAAKAVIASAMQGEAQPFWIVS